MHIAQVAPLYESVPPQAYGGTERIVHYLTESLIDAGHKVTLFASGDSLTRAELRSPIERALRLHGQGKDQALYHQILFEMVMESANRFDVIHFHNEYLHFPFARRTQVPTLTTTHGRMDLPDYKALFTEYPEMPMISISKNQQLPLPEANWFGTVLHGLPKAHLTPGDGGGDYLAFLGRISKEKRFDRAVEIAKRTGHKLKVAAKIDYSFDHEYVDRHRHLFDDPCVEFIGEIGDDKKSEFLGNAKAVLFPIDWPEPFGLVMIEAMACGTPSIAFRNGSVPEIIRDGVSGFIVDDVDEACARVNDLEQIDRKLCRSEFESRFTSERMANDYVSVYQKLIDRNERQLMASHRTNHRTPHSHRVGSVGGGWH